MSLLWEASPRPSIAVEFPADLPGDVAAAIGDNLWAASSVAGRLPCGLLEESQAAFNLGFNVAATVGAIGIMILAVVSAAALRHVGAIGSGEHDEHVAG